MKHTPLWATIRSNGAAKYVAERIDTTLAYLKNSIENLDAIASNTAEGSEAKPHDAAEPFVVLADGEIQRKTGRAEIEAAIAVLPQLRLSLETWSAQARAQTQI